MSAGVLRRMVKEFDYQQLMLEQDRKARFSDMDPAFLPLFEECRHYSMTSIERLYDLYKSVEYVVKAGIPGSIVECGVWKGGSMMLVAATLRHLGAIDRLLALYDTFDGHPPVKPCEGNTDIFGGDGARDWQPGWAKVAIEEVEKNMRLTGYPAERVFLAKGMVETTLPASVDALGCIAIARLDTDWYEPAKVELEALWPRLSVGGVLIVDDYGHYKGQRQAVDEYFADKPVKLTRVDYSCRVAQRIQ